MRKYLILFLCLLGFSGTVFADNYSNGYNRDNGTYVQSSVKTNPNYDYRYYNNLYNDPSQHQVGSVVNTPHQNKASNNESGSGDSNTNNNNPNNNYGN